MFQKPPTAAAFVSTLVDIPIVRTAVTQPPVDIDPAPNEARSLATVPSGTPR